METLWFTLFILLSGAVLLLILFDIIPVFYRWYSRIHIGRHKDKEQWRNICLKRLAKYLKKIPPVPVEDARRLRILDLLKGGYSTNKLRCWQEAAVLLGANKNISVPQIKTAAENCIRSKINPETGDWQNFVAAPDTALLAFALLSSPAANPDKIRPAMDTTARYLLDLSEQYGTIPYNTADAEIRFVDTLAMVCPFLVKYGTTYGDIKTIAAARAQINEFIRYGIHRETGLPAHCYNKTDGSPLGLYGWGRGSGWYALGLTASCLSLPSKSALTEAEHRFSADEITAIEDFRRELLETMLAFADAAEKLQMENGAWDRQLLLRKTGESTATALLGGFMEKTGELTGEERFSKAYDNSLKFLISCTRRNGVVDYAQGDTKGVGFYSRELDAMPAALGFAMML